MQKERDYGAHALLRSVILLGFFLLVFRLLLSGDIQYYIAPKMIPFTYFALVILLVLGVMQLWRSGSEDTNELYCNCGFDHTQTGSPFQTIFIYSLFVFPVLTGLWFPHTVLDSSIVVNRGIKYGTGLYGKPSEPTSDPDRVSFEETDFEEENEGINALLEELNDFKIELLNNDKIIVDDERYTDILYLMNEFPDLFSGKEMEVIGFVYKEPDFEENQFVVARFSITCCVADAVVLGVLATSDDASKLNEDQWVRATGHLSITTFDNTAMPYLHITKIDKIQQPEYPYVY